MLETDSITQGIPKGSRSQWWPRHPSKRVGHSDVDERRGRCRDHASELFRFGLRQGLTDRPGDALLDTSPAHQVKPISRG